jgi:hypothetical protein
MLPLRRITNEPNAVIDCITVDVYLGEQEDGDFQIRYFEPEKWTMEELAQVELVLLPRLERYPRLYFILRKRRVEQDGKVRNYHATFDFTRKLDTIMISTEDLTSFLRQIEEYCPL